MTSTEIQQLFDRTLIGDYEDQTAWFRDEAYALIIQMLESESEPFVINSAVQGDVDSSDIRDALLTCLSDTNEDVREEAAVGLGKRRDIRLLPALTQMLEAPDPSVRVADTASALLGLTNDPPEC